MDFDNIQIITRVGCYIVDSVFTTLQCITNSSLKSSTWFTMPVTPTLVLYKRKLTLQEIV
jgi:hypothetical protein